MVLCKGAETGKTEKYWPTQKIIYERKTLCLIKIKANFSEFYHYEIHKIISKNSILKMIMQPA